MLTFAGKSAKECVTRTQVTTLSKTCGVAKYSMDPQGHAGRKKQAKVSSWIRPINIIIHYYMGVTKLYSVHRLKFS